jgi:hypothetical protein
VRPDSRTDAAYNPTRVLTEIAMCCLAAGAKVQAALVDTAFGVVGYVRDIRGEGPGR